MNRRGFLKGLAAAWVLPLPDGGEIPTKAAQEDGFCLARIHAGDFVVVLRNEAGEPAIMPARDVTNYAVHELGVVMQDCTMGQWTPFLVSPKK